MAAWQPGLMRVAHFLEAGVRAMQGIDPSDYSDIESARLAGTNVTACLAVLTPTLSCACLMLAP